MSKITSETTYMKGPLEPKRQPDENSSPLAACIKRWEHKQDEVKGSRWSQCPADMAADFVRSLSHELILMYGGGEAAAQASMATAISYAQVNPDVLDIRLSCQAGEAGIDMVMTTGPEGEIHEENVLTLALDENEVSQLSELNSDKEIARALLANVEGVHQREVMDPLSPGGVPDEAILRLIQQVEEQLQIKPGDDRDMDVLFAAASVMLTWRQGEVRNAAEVNLNLEGLTLRDEDVYPGKCVKVKSKVRMFDNTINETLDKATEVEVAWPSKKPKP